jgi:hypothetical protein
MTHISEVIWEIADRVDEKRNPLQFMPYAEYLLTDHWKRVRQMKWNRSDGRCEKCKGRKHLQVHHKTYEHRGLEDYYLDDLIVLCDICHMLEHQRLGEDTSGWEIAKD